jgi:hypothetical protein
LAENFVYLFLNKTTERLSQSKRVVSYLRKDPREEIDFLETLSTGGYAGIEVKAAQGSAYSANRALTRGDINCVVKLQDSYGRVEGKRATLPIFAITKLDLVLEQMGYKQFPKAYETIVKYSCKIGKNGI